MASAACKSPDAHPNVVRAWLHAGGNASASSLAQLKALLNPLAAPQDNGATSTDSAQGDIEAPPQRSTTLSSSLTQQLLQEGYGDDDIYFRLRVLEEERHRGGAMVPLAYTTVMAVYFTLITLVIYSSVLITLVLTNFKFQTWEAVIFSFTLVSTAIISESETLLQVKEKLTGLKPASQSQSYSTPGASETIAAGPDGSTTASAVVPTASTVVPTTAAGTSAQGNAPVPTTQGGTPAAIAIPIDAHTTNQSVQAPSHIIRDEELSDG